MNTLRYWHRRVCDAWMTALIGEDVIARVAAEYRESHHGGTS